MMAAASSPLVPNLRFPEFGDALHWDTRPLGELAHVIAGQSPSGENYNTIGNGVPFYQGKTDFGDIYLRKPKKWTTQVTKLAQPGDILMSVRAPVGALNISTEQTCIGRGLASLRARCDKWFLYYTLLGQQGRIIGNGGSVFDSINKEQIEKLLILTPPTITEQQKIADCLGSLDDLIAAEDRKLEALRQHKQGLMQQLFPQPGETVPRLRFPEFHSTGEWAEKRLGDMGTLVSGLTYKPTDVQDGGLLVLRSSNIQDGEIALDDSVYVRPDVSGANLTQPDDILICVRNGSKVLIGKNALIPKGMPVCTHGAFMTVFRASAPKFARVLLQTTAYQKQVAADLGATINSINGSQLLKYRFIVPEPAEQRCIAECLFSLDEAQAAQSRKVDGLKAHKCGLLQRLFPNPEAR